jgi:predicted ester cyclase
MTTRKDTILHRWFEEVWNRGDVLVIDEMFHPDVRIHGLIDARGDEVSGVEHFKRFHQESLAVFSDIHVTVEDTVSEGDKVVACCTVREKHTGEGLGIGPTNKSLEYIGMCMVRLEGGKIVEAWNSFDLLAVFRQLGVISLPVK